MVTVGASMLRDDEPLLLFRRPFPLPFFFMPFCFDAVLVALADFVPLDRDLLFEVEDFFLVLCLLDPSKDGAKVGTNVVANVGLREAVGKAVTVGA